MICALQRHGRDAKRGLNEAVHGCSFCLSAKWHCSCVFLFFVFLLLFTNLSGRWDNKWVCPIWEMGMSHLGDGTRNTQKIVRLQHLWVRVLSWVSGNFEHEWCFSVRLIFSWHNLISTLMINLFLLWSISGVFWVQVLVFLRSWNSYVK